MLGGATRITNLDGKEMLYPINLDRLWKYNIWKRKREKPARLKTQKGGLSKS